MQGGAGLVAELRRHNPVVLHWAKRWPSAHSSSQRDLGCQSGATRASGTTMFAKAVTLPPTIR